MSKHRSRPAQMIPIPNADPSQVRIEPIPNAIPGEAKFVPIPNAEEDPPDRFFGTFFDEMRAYPSYGSSEFAVGPFLFGLAVSLNAKTIIEVGRFTGFSTLALAGALRFLDESDWSIPEVQKQRPDVDYPVFLTNGERQLISIDLSNSYGVPERMARLGLAEYIRFENADSHGLDLGAVQADLVFIDGDHSLEGLRQDVREYTGKYLRPGGYFILHDFYGWYDAEGKNGSPIAQVASEQVLGNSGAILIDTGFMSMVMFRKTARQ